ncbi:NACHT domain-containing protein [Streptomyces sp. NPDC005752]|uniref:NACHT domain-containing protein n=1 Tax=Streptomyces sp. NPDC005752 TaxID=3157065 RepID=UPI0033D35D7E
MSAAYSGAYGRAFDPGGLEPPRAAQIVAVRHAGLRVLGSGYRVTGDAVLTAAHVVRDATSILVRFVTEDRHAVDLPARLVWEHDEADVAVLSIADAAPAGGLPTDAFTRVRFGRAHTKVDCEALGFPRFKLRGDATSGEVYRDSRHAHGTITPWSNVRRGSLEFIVTGAPNDRPEPAGSAWEGMSGAAVWSGGCVVGVVSEQHRSEGPGTLTASRVENWYQLVAPDRLRELGELIGLPVSVGGLEQLPRPPELSGGAAGREEEVIRLAAAVRQQWRAEQRRRRLHDPYALAVRFSPADSALFDAERVPGFLSGREPPSRLADQITQVVAGYRAIESGRMVVLGEAGAGKTVLLLYVVIELLRTRAPGDPVPVIFSLGSWNPATTGLDEWLCDLLVRDYPDLALLVAPGVSLARALVDEDRILPVLDGFDEIAADLRGEALMALNESGMPLLLTSRPHAYAAAVRDANVRIHAPCIELGDLTPDDLAPYLRGERRAGADGDRRADADGDRRSSLWDPVLAQLREQPRSPGASNVAAALTTPLMASLARTVCGGSRGAQPQDLLEVANFSDSDAIQEYLLKEFVPAAYHPRRTGSTNDRGTGRRKRRGWDLQEAEHYLGHLAGHLDSLSQGSASKSHDLAWWELGTTLPRSTRTLVIGLLAGLAFGITTAIANVPVVLVATSQGTGFALLRGLLAGLLHGLAAGLIFGLAYHFTSEGEAFRPSPVRISVLGRLRTFGGPRLTHGKVRPRFMIGLGGGFVVALALLLIDRGVIEPLGLPDGQGGGGFRAALLFLAEISLGGGLVFGLMAWLETPVPPRTTVRPVDLLDTNRRNVMYHLLAWVCVLGPVAGIIEGIQHGPVRGLATGLVFGLVSAFAGGIGYGLSMTAWCQWVALCRIYLPLRGRLPWALVAFLDDAHRRGVLHRSGAVYQFRHARLQDHLSRTFHERHGRTPARPTRTGGKP